MGQLCCSDTESQAVEGANSAPEAFLFGVLFVDPDLVRLWIFASFMPFIGLLLWLPDSIPGREKIDSHPPLVSSQSYPHDARLSLEEEWIVPLDETAKSLVYKGSVIRGLQIAPRKEAFFQWVLPVAIIAMSEVANERQWLLETLDRYPGPDVPTSIDVLTATSSSGLSAQEKKRLQNIARKYRSSRPTELLKRIDFIPMSLLLAQAAIESSWGESRFASQGNNLFGMWTWEEEGMIPLERDEGETHKVASYASLLASVRAYILTLNRHAAYDHFRSLRADSSDSLTLALGLLNYSQRREEYIRDVKAVISHNRLQRYD